jgi:hypothetical protein
MRPALIFTLLLSLPLFAADLKVKTIKRMTTAGFVPPLQVKPEQTVYVHDMVQREEFVGYVDSFPGPKGQEPHMAVITHCDTGLAYEIDLDSREFRELKVPKYPTREHFETQVAKARKEEERHTKASTVDTGETRDFYGHTAKHLITNIKRTTGQVVSENAVDGWYIDFPQPGCAPEYLRWNRGHEVELANLAFLVPNTTDRPVEIARISPGSALAMSSGPKFIYTGFLPIGLAIQQKSVLHQAVFFNSDKKPSEVVTASEVAEFAEGPLDPALFEVPAGFKKVKHLYEHIKKEHER